MMNKLTNKVIRPNESLFILFYLIITLQLQNTYVIKLTIYNTVVNRLSLSKTEFAEQKQN